MTAIFTRDTSYFRLEGLGQKQAEVLDVIRQFGPIFDRAIGLKLGWPINRVTPRRSELVESGLVVGAGTICDPLTRRSVMLWRVVMPIVVQVENTDVKNTDINRSEPSAEGLEDLARLREKRDMAWRGFNSAIAPSKENNGWPAFAKANSEWVKLYRNLYGCRPPEDATDRISTRYQEWLFSKRSNRPEVWVYSEVEVKPPAKKDKKPLTDAQRSIINDKRRVGYR